MDHLPSLEQILAALGAIGSLFTVLAPMFPKGSPVGKFFARFGADLKGHNS
jgi:hypothetical protein